MIFLKCFLTSDLSLDREVEFAIDFVPGTNPVSMGPYRIFTS